MNTHTHLHMFFLYMLAPSFPLVTLTSQSIFTKMLSDRHPRKFKLSLRVASVVGHRIEVNFFESQK